MQLCLYGLKTENPVKFKAKSIYTERIENEILLCVYVTIGHKMNDSYKHKKIEFLLCCRAG